MGVIVEASPKIAVWHNIDSIEIEVCNLDFAGMRITNSSISFPSHLIGELIDGLIEIRDADK